MSLSLQQRLANGSKRAAMSAAVGAGLSAVFLGGLEPTRVFGIALPKMIVSGAALGVASFTSEILMEKVIPWEKGLTPGLKKFEHLVIEPVVAGAAVLAFEMIVSPSTVAATGGFHRFSLEAAPASLHTTFWTKWATSLIK